MQMEDDLSKRSVFLQRSTLQLHQQFPERLEKVPEAIHTRAEVFAAPLPVYQMNAPVSTGGLTMPL